MNASKDAYALIQKKITEIEGIISENVFKENAEKKALMEINGKMSDLRQIVNNEFYATDDEKPVA